jgi:hypothetical protein
MISGFSTLTPRDRPMPPDQSSIAPIQKHLDRVIADLLASLPKPDGLSAEERRGIIARYTAVLEGNFIYWMTGSLSGQTPPARKSWRTSMKRCATLIR